MNYCVIDIGSNSIRMLLDGVKALETTRLGEGATSGGGLNAAAVARSLDALEQYAHVARQSGAYIAAFATSAVREARDKDAFIEAVKRRCGVDVRVLSGEEEARLAFMGAAPRGGGLHCVLDVGGGSAEVVSGSHGGALTCASLPAGAVRLCSLFPPGDPPDRALAARMLEHAGTLYEEALGNLAHMPDTFTAIGGTATSLAAMDMALERYDAARVQGYTLPRSAVERWHGKLLSMSLEARRALPGLDYRRAEIIIGGLTSMLAFMRAFGAPALRVSDSDNLDAVMETLMSNGIF